MPKIVVTSDFHIAEKYPFTVSPNPMKDVFFLKAYAGAKEVIDYAIENKMDIIHGGDWFDKDKYGGAEAFITYTLIENLRKAGRNIFVNLGNHGMEYVSAVPSMMQVIANIRFYTHMYTIPLKAQYFCCNWNGLNVYLLPYYKEGVFNEVLTSMMSVVKQPAALVIHQNIKGIQLGKTSMKDGLSPAEFCQKLSGKFRFVVCGHLHAPNVIMKFGVPIIIPGSTCSVDFRDEKIIKAFYVVSMDKNFKVQNIQKKIIQNQIYFETYNLDLDVLDFPCRGKVIKLCHKAGDDYQEAEKTLLKNGAIRVIPELVSDKSTSDLQSYTKPIDMATEDWFKLFINNVCLDEEEHKAILKKHEELFGGKYDSDISQK